MQRRLIMCLLHMRILIIPVYYRFYTIMGFEERFLQRKQLVNSVILC